MARIRWPEAASVAAALGAALSTFAAPPAARAQTAIEEVRARRDVIQRDEPRPLEAPRVRFTSQRPPSNADEIGFALAGIEIAGATAFAPEALAPLYAGDLGREVTLTRVFEIAAEIQRLYRDADLIFTRVVVPAQEIEGGLVRLEVIEARIEAVVVEEPEGPVGPVRRLVERMVEPMAGVLNPTGALIERTVLNVNELPGITRATVVPQSAGPEARGGLVLHLNIERDPDDGVLYADNRQTPAIGRGVFGGSYTFNSYSAWADTTTISLFNSFDILSDKVPETGETDPAGDFDERTTALVTHSRAIGASGLVGEIAALYSRTKPGDDLKSLGIDGDQYFATAELSYPLVRSRRAELDAAFGFEFLNSGTDISNGDFRITDDRLRVAAARLAGLRRDEFGYWRFEATIRQGLDILNASQPGDLDLSRIDGRSVFTLARATAERLLVINEDLEGHLRIGGQYSLDPLLAPEEFSIGGLTYGRGYDPSEYTGDHGFGSAAELRYVGDYVIREVAFSAEGYGFVDFGVIWNRGDGEPARESILSAGGGVRFSFPSGLYLNAELAFPVNRPLERVGRSGEPIEGPRYFFTVSQQF